MMLLDVGCGDGRRLTGQIEYCVGIDIVETELRRAKEKLSRFGFALGDVQYLPFKDEVFDTALCSHVIEHVHQPKQLLQEVHRVMKRGGFLELEVPNGFALLEYANLFFGKIGWSQYMHLHRFSPEDVSQLLQQAGWVVVDVQRISWLGPVIDSIYFHLHRTLSKDPDRTSQRYAQARIEEINRFRTRKWVVNGLDRILAKAFPSRCAVLIIMAKKV
jgi:ubiquinone/menaquinone biosynthesis C-methylase UbiE